MKKCILITGGAGFIGSHLAEELIEQGYKVRVLDNLSKKVNGSQVLRPDYLHPEVELIVGDVRDELAVLEALNNVDAVFHFASMVGEGQSKYQVREYTEVNNLGTAVLLEALVEKPVKKLIIASSMGIYGEGMYCDESGKLIEDCSRELNDLRNQKWEMHSEDGKPYYPLATPENKKPSLSSVYALSKYDQENLGLILGKAYGIPTTALRFFNVYGTYQSLSNPYSGVLAIFASRMLNNNPPLIFEDGMQKRDFVHVKDVARACRLALETSKSDNEVFNIGSGYHYTIHEVVEKLAKVLGKNIPAELTSKYRLGDIRHCFADISKAKTMLAYEPQVDFEDGLYELVQWMKKQITVDSMVQATEEWEYSELTV